MEVIGVVGLEYVGLPLAVVFGMQQRTIGYDLFSQNCDNYRHRLDPADVASSYELRTADRLSFTTDDAELVRADFIFIAVPTPINATREPDFAPLIGASESVGPRLKQGITVVYESTVYPCATVEVCIPVLERVSPLEWQRDFQVGYFPERINSNDELHTLLNAAKVVSGDSTDTMERVARLYEKVVAVGDRVSLIKVAEAAKVIENTQRDLNIALMNELEVILNMLGLDTQDVFEAAGTKWNFMPFRPGLVGGYCIGVDPYYLTYKAEMLGYHADVILAGRRINDNIGKFIAEQTVKQLIQAGSQIKGAKVNVLGMTFKEDVPDLRNSKVGDIVEELRAYGVDVFVHDPIADVAAADAEYGIELIAWEQLPQAGAVIVAVAHEALLSKPYTAYLDRVKDGGCFIDVKAQFDAATLSSAGLKVWRL